MTYLFHVKSKNIYILIKGFMFFICMKQITAEFIRYKALYSGSVSDYDVVIPKRILANGTEIKMVTEDYRNRFRRDISGMEKLRIKLYLSSRNEILELWPSFSFISNNLKIEMKSQKSSHEISSKFPTMCHYRGIIKGQPESSVAVSACSGLVGYIKTSAGQFWIEPSKNFSNSNNEITHILFRRDAVTQVYSKRKRRKRRKKHENLCGTKEPHRIVESQLEWNQKPGWVRVQGRGRRRGTSSKGLRHSSKRIRRSVSKEQHVETLLVADYSMVEFYNGEDIEMYLLSIMNMVSVMYQDPSIGNYINIVVVRIILLEEDTTEGLNITINADKTLDSFCRWQKSLNKPLEDDPLHHDVAILITRKDICSGADTPCSTLGVAHVGGMCQPDRSCSVNEDNGITLAHTIAHELGHNFGMYHDSKKVGCSGHDGSTQHIMTPSFEANTLHIAWSPCSRRDITHFLDGGLGTCLEDKPTISTPLEYPELPVGVIYNAEYQCKLQFGVEDSSVCIPIDEVCSKLWCIVDNLCTTMLHPAAPGTSCGKHKWCERQQCVGMEDKIEVPVDGGWGKWSEWSPCSRTCGAGVSTTVRQCDHPPPSNGGKYCLGQRMRYKICNTEDCLDDSVSFRAEQCSSFNNKTVFGRNEVTWLPYFESKPCRLYCTDKDETTIMPMGVPVLDGTPCNLGTRDMCISGLCHKVGCDWVVESNAEEDKCGVCKGDGSLCVTITGYYNKTYGSGYTEFVSIPKNARNILIEELGNSKNYISVGSTSDDTFYLNGNKAITLPGEYTIANSQALYRRQKEREKLHILGPIQEAILIYLIFQGSYKNSGIRFEYTLPHLNINDKTNYEWGLSDWTACSVTCGGGMQYTTPVCKEKDIGIVNSSFCSSEKPAKSVRTCNLQPCTHRWWTGPWQLCPVTCGDLALRSRTVLCISNDDHQIALPDSDCEDQPRPHQEEPCINTPSCLSSIYLFTNVSNSDYIMNQSKSKRLQFKANFQDKSRNKWIILPWSQCSVSCGLGFKKRTVYCSRGDICDTRSKPIEMKQCFKKCLIKER
ncbi:A disintegrin and metalloproteinase with thrombospondin motifs 12-like isoform X2 [Lycorma delicatula]|uniref:A disintegrin and metalloproteinase with thrombospondin motifs 12-like isoform X2 n=1 Tax=Lycorma delicatula TaxID=130591 RepID=UPI003F513FF6